MTRAGMALLLCSLLTLTACVLPMAVPIGGGGGGKDARCHPSQYWDGNQCRHKGKGQGARKHDGR